MKAVFRSVYGIIPFKREFFHLLRFLYAPPENIYRHLHFKGLFRVKTSNGSFTMRHYGYLVENEIFWKGLTGSWEKESLRLWMQLCRLNETILDIGANTGVYALTAKTVQPQAKIFAFEPFPNAHKKLEANARLNGYDIVSIEAALSDKDGKASIYPDSLEHTYSVTVNRNRLPGSAAFLEMEIEIIRLSTFIEKYGIERVGLMKIDVENHEVEVLKGMGHYLAAMRPAMLVEVLDDETGRGIEQLISGLGYIYFNIDEMSGPKQVERISQSTSTNYLLCNFETAKQLKLL